MERTGAAPLRAAHLRRVRVAGKQRHSWCEHLCVAGCLTDAYSLESHYRRQLAVSGKGCLVRLAQAKPDRTTKEGTSTKMRGSNSRPTELGSLEACKLRSATFGADTSKSNTSPYGTLSYVSRVLQDCSDDGSWGTGVASLPAARLPKSTKRRRSRKRPAYPKARCSSCPPRTPAASTKTSTPS